MQTMERDHKRWNKQEWLDGLSYWMIESTELSRFSPHRSTGSTSFKRTLSNPARRVLNSGSVNRANPLECKHRLADLKRYSRADLSCQIRRMSSSASASSRIALHITSKQRNAEKACFTSHRAPAEAGNDEIEARDYDSWVATDNNCSSHLWTEWCWLVKRRRHFLRETQQTNRLWRVAYYPSVQQANINMCTIMKRMRSWAEIGPNDSENSKMARIWRFLAINIQYSWKRLLIYAEN